MIRRSKKNVTVWLWTCLICGEQMDSPMEAWYHWLYRWHWLWTLMMVRMNGKGKPTEIVFRRDEMTE